MNPETEPETGPAQPTPWSRVRVAVLAVVAVYLAAALPLILTQHDRGRGRFDQVNYHEPAILRFAEQLPSPDVSDYLSATTPGYHLALSVVARLVSPSPVVLQLVGTVFTVGLLCLFTGWTARRAGVSVGAILGLALIASLYVFPPGVYLLPDNAAWFGVLGILLIALRPKADAATFAGGGAVLLALLLTRQSHLWTLGVLFAAAWLGPVFRPARPGAMGGLGEVVALFGSIDRRLGRLMVIVLACAPALLVLAWFVRLWGGLTVPIYQDYMGGINPATPAFILAQFGVVGAFHAAFWAGPLGRLARGRWWIVAGAAAFGLVAALVPETTYDLEAGRYSGLWNAARLTPDVLGRTSPVLAVLAPAGAVALAGWLAGLDPRSRWVMLGALAGFFAAMSATHNAWQRYHEPLVLISSGVMSAMIASRGGGVGPAARLARLAGPAALAAGLAVVTAWKLSSETLVVGRPLRVQESVSTPLETLWPNRWPRFGIDPGGAGGGAAGDGGDAAGP